MPCGIVVAQPQILSALDRLASLNLRVNAAIVLNIWTKIFGRDAEQFIEAILLRKRTSTVNLALLKIP